MFEVKSGGARGAASQGPLVITAVAALVVGAAIAAAVFLATGGGGPSPPGTAKVHDVWIVIDPEVCPQKDCVCATPLVLKASRGDIVRWINATSAKVTITPSKSDTFVGSTNPAGAVNVDMRQTLPATISSSLKVKDIIQMTLTLEGEVSLCQGSEGPRMEIDN